jgi:hypothetical protein
MFPNIRSEDPCDEPHTPHSPVNRPDSFWFSTDLGRKTPFPVPIDQVRLMTSRLLTVCAAHNVFAECAGTTIALPKRPNTCNSITKRYLTDELGILHTVFRNIGASGKRG